MITARILADSINPHGKRLTSWLVTYPRFIHSELLTHRQFSRSSASSRAIPVRRMLADVIDHPAAPERWGTAGAGMQDGGALAGPEANAAWEAWMNMRFSAVDNAKTLYAEHKLSKQIVNRTVEPWAHITVLLTIQDHSNFFQLRAHPAAQPEFQVLAYRMLDAYLKSTPTSLDWCQWHIPQFVGQHEDQASSLLSEVERLKVAVARCARLSYLTFDGEFSVQADLDLFGRLFGPPMHGGAFEHVAQAIDPFHKSKGSWGKWEGRHYPWSNFDSFPAPSGWGQYRKLYEGEAVHNLDRTQLLDVLDRKPEWVHLTTPGLVPTP